MMLKYVKKIKCADNKNGKLNSTCEQDVILEYLGNFLFQYYKSSIVFKGGLYLHELLEGSDIVHEPKEPPPRVSRAFAV